MWTAIWNNQVAMWNLATDYLLIKVIDPKHSDRGTLGKISYPPPLPQTRTKLMYALDGIPSHAAGRLRRKESDSEGHFGDAGGHDN